MMVVSRRRFLGGVIAATGAAGFPALEAAAPRARWPSAAQWERLRTQVGGRLIAVQSPLRACLVDPAGATCATALTNLQNPFYNEAEPGATQTTGWHDAWNAAVSPYAVAARSARDVAAAVNFARAEKVRLVVKGTGHDYLGRSNAPDSLLVWTHAMRQVTVHKAFRTAGSKRDDSGVPAVSAAAGARWLEVYGTATQAGRYVQGGGCTSVGAAGGFIQGSGFGSFSKRFGTGAGGVLEYEVVTAEGAVRIANDHFNPDLFWALRGGGGGTFGIVTRVTLRSHPIPERVGSLLGRITAKTDAAFRELVIRLLRFYETSLANEHWGEKYIVNGDNTVDFAMTNLDLTEAEARNVWRPVLDWLASRPDLYTQNLAFRVIGFRHLWDAAWWARNDPSNIVRDPRPGQPPTQFWWASNQGEVSAFIRSYQSRWLPIALMSEAAAPNFADTLIAAAKHWHITLQFNKGLAGAPPEAIARDRQTALNPVVFDAACLMLAVSDENGVYPNVPGHQPNAVEAAVGAARIDQAMRLLRDATPGSGAYANEADYFELDWQRSFWGTNYTKLLEIKRKYDPGNLFRVHHGVGSEG